jgi:hypothetical protein
MTNLSCDFVGLYLIKNHSLYEISSIVPTRCLCATGYVRIALAVAAFAYAMTDHKIFFVCYLLSELLDALDGHAARYFKQCTLPPPGLSLLPLCPGHQGQSNLVLVSRL